jgi:hypothetical protein
MNVSVPPNVRLIRRERSERSGAAASYTGYGTSIPDRYRLGFQQAYRSRLE